MHVYWKTTEIFCLLSVIKTQSHCKILWFFPQNVPLNSQLHSESLTSKLLNSNDIKGLLNAQIQRDDRLQ